MGQEERVGKGVGGDGICTIYKTHHDRMQAPYHTYTTRKNTNGQTHIRMFFAHMCAVTKTQQDATVQGWAQEDVNESDGK